MLYKVHETTHYSMQSVQNLFLTGIQSVRNIFLTRVKSVHLLFLTRVKSLHLLFLTRIKSDHYLFLARYGFAVSANVRRIRYLYRMTKCNH